MMELNPMWLVAGAVIVALGVAYRHGRLAGFVSKVKADEKALAARGAAAIAAVQKSRTEVPNTGDKPAAARLENLTNGQGGKVTEWDVLTKEGRALLDDASAVSKKFGDELKGWVSKAQVATEPPAPQPTLEQRVAAIKSELDDLIKKA